MLVSKQIQTSVITISKSNVISGEKINPYLKGEVRQRSELSE